MRAGATDLPVEEVLDEVVAALDDGLVVLQAPTGAGKTTRVPLALLDRPWLGSDRIVMLEPRRLAARASARRMADLLGEPAGRTVGYITRDEQVVSESTRIEVVTEGILVRRIQRDPGLDGVAGVLFDEYHERSLPADLGLALSLEVRSLRPDLRLGVMSATLEGERVAALLETEAFVESAGRSHPVETHYRPRPLADHLEPHVADAVEEALEAESGHVLVFLPGAREIRWVQRELKERGIAARQRIAVTPLFGALPPREQDRAIEAAPAGVRKIILSTDIAETSLTIEGVRSVVDSGLTRIPQFDPTTGMSRLATVRVSRASADQRRGRAGRTAPGTCYRLWSRSEHAGLDPHTTPEIAQADLASFALEVAAWGVSDPGELRLLDAPPEDAWRQAVRLLGDLEAVDGDGRITAHGEELVGLPLHPRLGHMIVRARQRGLGALACDAAAVLADRDPVSTSYEHPNADLIPRVRLVRGEGRAPRGASVRRGALSRARREARRLRRIGGIETGEQSPPGTVAGEQSPPGTVADGADVDRVGEVLAYAYPDRVARRRGEARGRFVLSNGRGASLADNDLLADEDLLVVAAVDRGRREARIHLAAAVDLATLETALAHRIETVEEVAWDDAAGDVVAERQERLGSLVLRRHPLSSPEDAATTAALIEGIRARGLDLLPWSGAARSFRHRAQFLRRHLGGDWPDLSDEVLLEDLEEWLAPYLAGCRRVADLAEVPLLDALRGRVGWDRARTVDELAPTHVTVPSGSRVRLDYSGEVPSLPVRVQEMFGATTTPRVADGRVQVRIELLSPADRPVAVTQDLAGFWERTWPEVRAEMRGRYTKHAWPEDPLRAVPHRGTKPGR